jgi:uncharacterized membrane protein YfcA
MSLRESLSMGKMEVLDRIGVFASMACFLHCLAMPIVLSLLTVYAHFLPSEERTHRILAVFITVIGVLALLTGYRKHGRYSVLILMSCGLLLVCSGAFFGDRLPSHWMEVLITLAGSSCLILAHRINHTFCRSCTECCVSDEEEPRSPYPVSR